MAGKDFASPFDQKAMVISFLMLDIAEASITTCPLEDKSSASLLLVDSIDVTVSEYPSKTTAFEGAELVNENSKIKLLVPSQLKGV